MRLIERHFMRDDLRRIELACHNFLIQHRHVMNHVRLSHGQLHVSYPNVSEHELVVFRTVYPRNLNRAEFPHRIHGDVDRAERSANQLGLLLFLLQWRLLAVHSDAIDDDIRTPACYFFYMQPHVFKIFKVEDFDVIHFFSMVQPVREIVDRDDPFGAFHPGEFLRHQADGAAAEHNHRIPLLYAAVVHTPICRR